jgi:hypothetical protein
VEDGAANKPWSDNACAGLDIFFRDSVDVHNDAVGDVGMFE